jgi:hypothetical protein
MKKITLIILLVLITIFSYATDYYVSSSQGDDNNRNNTSATPWRTLDKLNNIHPIPGDRYLLKGGDSFYGSIITNSNGAYNKPIIITTYGGSAPATISGVTKVNNWTSVGGNIYYTSIGDGNILRNVLMDGIQQGEGRYPDDYPGTGGFLVYQSYRNYAGYSTITSNNIPQFEIDSTFIGSILHVKSYLATLETGKVLSARGDSLSFDNTNMFYQLGYNGCGFFITGSIKTLSLQGEWYYDNKEKRLYMYFVDDPTNHTVEVATKNILFEPRNSYYNVNNIVFRGANEYGISCNWLGRKSLILRNVQILYSGISGVAIANLNKLVMDGCMVRECGSNGMNVGYNCDSVSITNSVITNVAVLAQSLFCDPQYQKRAGYGIYSGKAPTYGLHIENTTVSNTAYIGIFFSGSNNRIYRNYIHNTCKLLDDGGGIYYGGLKGYEGKNNIIRRNIVVNTQGYHLGFPYPFPIPNSIFLDDNASEAVIDSNFVQGSGQTCLYIHNGRNCTVKNNTFIDARWALIQIQDDVMGDSVKNININHNSFLPKDSTQFIYYLAATGNPTDNSIDKFGKMDYNYFLIPNMNKGFHYNTFNKGWVDCGISDWRIYLPYEWHSVATPTKGNTIRTYYTTDKDSTIYLSGVWYKTNGRQVKDSIKLKDHTGIILYQPQNNIQ